MAVVLSSFIIFFFHFFFFYFFINYYLARSAVRIRRDEQERAGNCLRKFRVELTLRGLRTALSEKPASRRGGSYTRSVELVDSIG